MCKECSEESKAVLDCVAYIEGTGKAALSPVLLFYFRLCSIKNACLPRKALAFILDISFSLCIVVLVIWIKNMLLLYLTEQ